MDVFMNIFFGLEKYSGVDEINFLNKVIPNLTAFLVQFIAFIIMCFVVWKLAYKPIRAFLDKRKEFINNNLEEASKKNEEADKNLEESKSGVINARREATKIVQEAKKEAESQKAAILESTKQEIAAAHVRAAEDLKKEQEKAIKQVHDQVVDLAIETSKSILEREVEIKDDQKLIDNLVDELMEKK